MTYSTRSLFEACAHRDEVTVKMLLEAGTLVNETDKMGNTLLIQSCSQNNPKMVSLLLAHGADPNIRNAEGYTAMTFAIKNNNREIIRLLLEHGSSVKEEEENSFVSKYKCICLPSFRRKK